MQAYKPAQANTLTIKKGMIVMVYGGLITHVGTIL